MNSRSNDQTERKDQATSRRHPHLPLQVYDFVILLAVVLFLLGFNPSSVEKMQPLSVAIHLLMASICVFVCRTIGGIYKQIWRYSSPFSYIRLIIADFFAGAMYQILNQLVPEILKQAVRIEKIEFVRAFLVISSNLLLSVAIRLLYQFFYEYLNKSDKALPFLRGLALVLTGLPIDKKSSKDDSADDTNNTKIRIAIVGAGRVGVALAEELIKNPRASYVPCCFVDTDRSKIGREILGLPVFGGDENVTPELLKLSVQEIVFALPNVEPEYVKDLYEYYKQTGCRVKIYDYPVMHTADKSKRQMREFDIEELLFRKPIKVNNDKTSDYYRDKVVLITGGGGSIGSELCRQIARMEPKSLVILDVYENGAYDIQQELRIAYGGKLNLCVEIVSVCDKEGVEKVISHHRPNIILHAAAHKHVPLMERNSCEAIKNNVFGTLNVVELAEKYEVERLIMVSTDKAVNPTNVMGATKRVCEMIVQSHSLTSKTTTFSATRFGNVLGSSASVVPLFKRQIMNGGPVTVTDKRIIRYFMTIPEASQLVLQSGAMAKNGELFVLDMGKSIRILELAETMIRLSGFEPYRDIDIIETGLRPGEKLYEELLIRTEELDKTENSLIFIERDIPLSADELKEKLDVLREAVDTYDDKLAKEALMRVVPTYHDPKSVNADVNTEKRMAKLSAEPEMAVSCK